MSELERDLQALGESLVFPPTPDIATAVARDLAPRTRSRWMRRLAPVAIAVAALGVGVTMAVPPARTAVLHFFGVGAVEIRFVDRLPAVKPGPLLPPGRRISARASPVSLLRSSLLGPPDALYSDGRQVTLVYGKPGSIRLLVTQIPYSGFTPSIAKKLAGMGTRADFVAVRSADGPAVWIEGQPHVVRFPGGPSRLAGNTLIWLRNGVTVRVEGALGRDRAVEIANSLHG